MEPTTESHPWSFLGKAHHPLKQAAATVVLMVIFLLASWFMVRLGPEGFSQHLPWIIALAFLLLFAVFNSVFCLAAGQVDQYWQRSILGFLVVGLVGASLAWAISGQFLTEVGSFKWMYMVVAFCYLVFISIINFMRKIVDFAQGEKWEKPKLKSRKRGY
ncbi:MAG: hypothetical protein K9I85_00350 [Saprospiraceae bacterium]|nr:hypothetical protein [Saprospiraceae bacterium]